jgi:hypothetical protein
VNALFADGIQPNESIGATALEADLIFGRDVMSGNQFLLWGRGLLEQLAAGEQTGKPFFGPSEN